MSLSLFSINCIFQEEIQIVSVKSLKKHRNERVYHILCRGFSRVFLLPHCVPCARGLPQDSATETILAVPTIVCSSWPGMPWHRHGMSAVFKALQHASDAFMFGNGKTFWTYIMQFVTKPIMSPWQPCSSIKFLLMEHTTPVTAKIVENNGGHVVCCHIFHLIACVSLFTMCWEIMWVVWVEFIEFWRCGLDKLAKAFFKTKNYRVLNWSLWPITSYNQKY